MSFIFLLRLPWLLLTDQEFFLLFVLEPAAHSVERIGLEARQGSGCEAVTMVTLALCLRY